MLHLKMIFYKIFFCLQSNSNLLYNTTLKSLLFLVCFLSTTLAQTPVDIEKNCVDFSNSTKDIYACQWTPFNLTSGTQISNFYLNASLSCPAGFQLIKCLGRITVSNCPKITELHFWISKQSHYDFNVGFKLEAPSSNSLGVYGDKGNFTLQAATVKRSLFLCTQNIRRDYRYLGCYRDNTAARDLDTLSTTLSNSKINSLRDCIDFCKVAGTNYMAIQNGTLCSCGQSYGKYGHSTICSISCIAPYSNETCGGWAVNAVYKIIKDAVVIPCETSETQTTESNFSTAQSTNIIILTKDQQTYQMTTNAQEINHETIQAITTDQIPTIEEINKSTSTVIIEAWSNGSTSSKLGSTDKTSHTVQDASLTSHKSSETLMVSSSYMQKSSNQRYLASTQSKTERHSTATETPISPRRAGQWTMWATSKCTLYKRRRNLKNPELIEIVEEQVTNLQLCDNLDALYRDALAKTQAEKNEKQVTEVKVKLKTTKEILELKYAVQIQAKKSFGWVAVIVVVTMFTIIICIDVTKIEVFRKIKTFYIYRQKKKQTKPRLAMRANVKQLEEFNPRRDRKNIDLERQILRKIRRTGE